MPYYIHSVATTPTQWVHNEDYNRGYKDAKIYVDSATYTGNIEIKANLERILTGIVNRDYVLGARKFIEEYFNGPNAKLLKSLENPDAGANNSA